MSIISQRVGYIEYPFGEETAVFTVLGNRVMSEGYKKNVVLEKRG